MIYIRLFFSLMPCLFFSYSQKECDDVYEKAVIECNKIDECTKKLQQVSNHEELISLFNEVLNHCKEAFKYIDTILEDIQENSKKNKETWHFEKKTICEKYKNTLQEVMDNIKRAIPCLNCLNQLREFCLKEVKVVDRAFAEIDVNNICAPIVLLNLEKIIEKKKKLEQMCIILDISDKKWEKQLPDLMQQIVSLPYLDDQIRKKFENFDRRISILGKQLFAVQKKFVLEFIKLLDLASKRYGTYKINDNKVYFLNETETKLYESFITNINKYFKEEQDVYLLIDQLMHDNF